MRSNKLLHTLAMCATLLLAGWQTVSASESVNVMVFNEDSDKDSVPNNSRVHKRVLRTLENELGDMGIKVYDETAAGLDQGFAQNRTRRDDGELIDIAKLMKRPPIDVAAVYSIYASVKRTEYIGKVRVRIEGRILNVKTGATLGYFEVKTPKEWTVPEKCNRECILEELGDDARTIGRDLGAVLGEKLNALIGDGESDGQGGGNNRNIGMAYVLDFKGFTPEEIAEIEEYLVIFSGYKSHSTEYAGARTTEFWYESSIGSSKLTRNLHKMLAELDLKGMVQFSGNTATIEKIVLRGRSSKSDRSGW